jgi:hypothetical protein
VHGEHRAVGALSRGREALGLLEDARVIDERAEEARRDRDVGGVEVLDALLVGEDRRRAPAVVPADVAMRTRTIGEAVDAGMDARCIIAPGCRDPS